MPILKLSKLKESDVRIHSSSIIFYSIFCEFILPILKESEIKFWTRYQCSQLFFYDKLHKNEYHLINNFFLINGCLMHELALDNECLSVELTSVKNVKAHEIDHLLFHELLFFIIRFKSELNLSECHKQLQTILSVDTMNGLFGVDRLTVPKFLDIVGISRNRYYRSEK